MLHLDTNNHHQSQKTPERPSTSAKVVYDKSASKSSGRWTKEEHQKFIEGLKKFGKNWKQVEEYVGTRNGAQIRSHAQKFFNRLEREFNLKFEDLNLQADHKKFDDTVRKMSESSYHTASSPTNAGTPEPKLSDKLQKNLSPIPEVQSHHESALQTTIQSGAFSLSNSPKLDHFEYPALTKRSSRKMSEDILHTIQTRPYSLFDVVMEKIRTSSNKVVSPRLSDFVDISSSTRSSFDAAPLKTNVIIPVVGGNEHFANSSFRLNARKMSEDNVLINYQLNRLRKPTEENVFSDVELLTKKFKVN